MTPAFEPSLREGKVGQVSSSRASIRASLLDTHPSTMLRDQFLREGNRPAAHMTDTMEVEGIKTLFESFMFAEVGESSGKLKWMNERSIWGPEGKDPVHGLE